MRVLWTLVLLFITFPFFFDGGCGGGGSHPGFGPRHRPGWEWVDGRWEDGKWNPGFWREVPVR